MTNVGNERGEILNSVFTTGEGAGLQNMCQGIGKRYQDANVPEPQIMYVDRDCCCSSGPSHVLRLFHPWQFQIRLDIWHFMRRFNAGLTTEHHPLYATWCSRLSSCIFEWDMHDMDRLKTAKAAELKMQLGRDPTEKQVANSLKTTEMARHCKRRTRGAEETKRQIDHLLTAMWDMTDTTGVTLLNRSTMTKVWQVQQKHVACIQDVPHVPLYTKVGTLEKGGKVLDVFRCARGSTSLESFHRHQ